MGKTTSTFLSADDFKGTAAQDSDATERKSIVELTFGDVRARIRFTAHSDAAFEVGDDDVYRLARVTSTESETVARGRKEPTQDDQEQTGDVKRGVAANPGAEGTLESRGKDEARDGGRANATELREGGGALQDAVIGMKKGMGDRRSGQEVRDPTPGGPQATGGTQKGTNLGPSGKQDDDKEPLKLAVKSDKAKGKEREVVDPAQRDDLRQGGGDRVDEPMEGVLEYPVEMEGIIWYDDAMQGVVWENDMVVD